MEPVENFLARMIVTVRAGDAIADADVARLEALAGGQPDREPTGTSDVSVDTP